MCCGGGGCVDHSDVDISRDTSILSQRRWKDYINMNIRRVCCEERRWLEMAQNCIQ
jgi:hypothetical protein